MDTSSPRTATIEADVPVAGDVIVARQPGTHVHFLVRQLPHDPGFTLPSRHRAIEIAMRFARAHAIDLWLVEGHVVTRLERRRQPR